MTRNQRYLTGILTIAILGTIVGMKAWTPDRRTDAPTVRLGGQANVMPVNNTMPLSKPAPVKGGS